MNGIITMKNLIILFSLFAPVAGNASISCLVEKTLVKYDAETKKLDVKKATTLPFLVTDLPHEDVKVLRLTQLDGIDWGEVSVVTGSYEESGIASFYANATTADQNKNITSYVTLKSQKNLAKSSALTIILDGSDVSPTLTITCFQLE